MDDFDTAHLIYLIMLGLAVVFWFVASNREKLGTVVQQALIWGLIFVGVIAAVGLWEDVRRTVKPPQIIATADNQIKLRRATDGHYYLPAVVNGTAVRFMVDTGASDIVLTQADARSIGLKTDDLAYVGYASTANGEVRTAPVKLDSFTVGPIHDTSLRAVVNQGEMEKSLLGMSYLQRYSSVEFTDGTLVLTR